MDFDFSALLDEELDDSPPFEPTAGTQTTVVEAVDGESIIFDIETGPRPFGEIQSFYTPPPAIGAFDPSSVKCGNLGEAKAKEKIEKARAEHAEDVRNAASYAEIHCRDWLGKAALSPITGQVLAVGFARRVAEKTVVEIEIIDASAPGGERAILERFWEVAKHVMATSGQLIGFNSNGFDLPFLIRRSWALDVDVPDGLIKGRYFAPVFVDLMQVWQCGGRDFIGLDALAKFFGVGGKPDGVDGGMFSTLWSDPKTRQQALDYLTNDLVMTAAVARKMGVC